MLAVRHKIPQQPFEIVKIDLLVLKYNILCAAYENHVTKITHYLDRISYAKTVGRKISKSRGNSLNRTEDVVSAT